MDKPQVLNFNQAAENNKAYILEKLQALFTESGTVLEIGSGSGQHALHFSGNLPHLTWQPCDQADYIQALTENVRNHGGENLLAPLELEVASVWPEGIYHYAYSANVLHIMSADLIPGFFSHIAERLVAGGLCCIYGPFRYGGEFTTESNARFDVWLRDTYADGGIRDIEMVRDTAMRYGLALVEDYNMPANNQLLVFQRS